MTPDAVASDGARLGPGAQAGPAMGRRAFVVSGFAGLLALHATARAQPSRKAYRIGVLGNQYNRIWEGFELRLRELGYVEGQNLVIERRFSEGQQDRFPHLAAELAALNPDLIVVSATPAALAVRQATSTTPIVMAGGVNDPVGSGLVASLGRPGGNITGFSHIGHETFAKQLEILKELAPNAVRIGILWSASAAEEFGEREKGMGQALGLALQPALARQPEDVEQAFASIVRERCDGVLVYGSGVTFQRSQAIVDLAARHRLPAMYVERFFVDRGGLASYGPSYADLFRRTAEYVDRILKGAKPGDLPIQQATKFDLVINLKTAKALGLAIPQSLLLRADEVIK